MPVKFNERNDNDVVKIKDASRIEKVTTIGYIDRMGTSIIERQGRHVNQALHLLRIVRSNTNHDEYDGPDF